ncbi:helix-turn-helix domain-containing protein [Patescibacteria group bacterium]|nr:helix-turn-helix domain-containing protein [Patescibacteria group bacterium]
MTRFKDREKALTLRKQGQSYSQIKKILGVGKGTLSVWLKNYPLSKQRIRELRDWSEQRIEKFRATMREKRQGRLDSIYTKQKKILLPLTNREVFLIGLGLYWGEGTKCTMSSLSVSNTNPAIIKFYIYWLNKCLDFPKDKMIAYLHLYNDMDARKEIFYWSKILNIPESQFPCPYIKKTSSKRINYKGTFGHGTCNLRASGVPLTEKIFMNLKILADKYGRERL